MNDFPCFSCYLASNLVNFCVFRPSGRMGARQCEGELSGGSSRPLSSICWTSTQPGPPAAPNTSERERRGGVAPFHRRLLLTPVCAWIHICLIRPFPRALIPSCKGTAQSHSWVYAEYFGWIWLWDGGWMFLSDRNPVSMQWWQKVRAQEHLTKPDPDEVSACLCSY